MLSVLQTHSSYRFNLIKVTTIDIILKPSSVLQNHWSYSFQSDHSDNDAQDSQNVVYVLQNHLNYRFNLSK